MSPEEINALIKKFEKEIKPQIKLDDEFKKNGSSEVIYKALQNIYVKSEIAREDMFNPWINSGGLIHIDYIDGAAAFVEDNENDPRGKVLVFNVNYPAKYVYLDNNGTAVQGTLESVLTHELVHLLKSTGDTGVGGNQFTGDLTDLQGETVFYANEIFKQLGIPEQNSYIGADDLGILEPGRQYTSGAPIDRSEVVIGGQEYSPDHNPGSRDLLIGDAEENEMSAGDGNDFLYGGGGDDHLRGGSGLNYLYGGKGDDTYYIGAESATEKTFDVIYDSDGIGKIKLEGQPEVEFGEVRQVGKPDDSALNSYLYMSFFTYEDANYRYIFSPVTPKATIGTLTIVDKSNGKNLAIINGFDKNRAESDEGYLGIKFKPQEPDDLDAPKGTNDNKNVNDLALNRSASTVDRMNQVWLNTGKAGQIIEVNTGGGNDYVNGLNHLFGSKSKNLYYTCLEK